MQECLEKLQISPMKLQQQANNMHHYYSTPAEETSKSVYNNDEICEILLCQKIFVEYINNLLYDDSYPNPDSWRCLQEFLIIKINDRIPMNEQNPSVLNEKLKKLFNHTESIMQNWKNEDNTFTNYYIKIHKWYIYQQLHLKKSKIFEIWYKRIYELNILNDLSIEI